MPLINVSDLAILGVQTNNRGRVDHNDVSVDNSYEWNRDRGGRGSRDRDYGHGHKGGKRYGKN